MSLLGAGDVRRAVTQLVGLAEEDHYRECRWDLLMSALDRDQRQGEAIAVYERLAARLANDLGVRPSEPLPRLRPDIPTGPTALSERALEPFSTEELRREAAGRPRYQEDGTSTVQRNRGQVRVDTGGRRLIKK